MVPLGEVNTYSFRGSKGDNNIKSTADNNRDGYNNLTSDYNSYWDATKGDLTVYVLTPEDPHMRKVYIYWVHTNYGIQLDGGTADKEVWKTQWHDFMVML